MCGAASALDSASASATGSSANSDCPKHNAIATALRRRELMAVATNGDKRVFKRRSASLDGDADVEGAEVVVTFELVEDGNRNERRARGHAIERPGERGRASEGEHSGVGG